MGALYAQSLADQMGRSSFMIEEHLTKNCCPPIPRQFSPACLLAIEAVETDEEDAEITLPKGCNIGGRKVFKARELVELCHLQPFIELYFEDDDDLNVPNFFMEDEQ